MCTTCGCGAGEVKIDGEHAHHEHDHVHADGTTHSHDHDHDHGHGAGGAHEHVHESPHAHAHAHSYAPAHSHAPGVSAKRMVQIEQDILSKNNAYAAENRQRLADRGIFTLNLVSSPGSGKTTLLVKTIELLKGSQPVAVIEGDQQTSQDAERIRATGAPAIQINTGKGCHLDAHMVGHAMGKLELPEDSLLMIENVGNLVCPAAFDLGEAHKVVILSVTEGEDKPIKYPDMFRAATLMLMNKCDLLPHLAFSVPKAIEFARRVNPGIEVIEVSATSGQGMDDWLAWIARGAAASRVQRQDTVDSLQRRVAELEGQLAARSA
ncbi:MAG: hydrogenase nickel incorporation protein HypB [Rhodocyclales bacterium]|nr:hydrogenase nickel incorporation protein HypB [Rhodocyclales bacterium]